MRYFLSLIVMGFLCQSAAANPAATQALNALRTARGLAPVTYSDTLEAAAASHGRDMARQGYFSHEGRNGSSVGDRVRQQGYDWCVVAENIAKGQRDLGEVMQGWANSPGHLANMTRRDVTEFGLYEANDRIWVMVLGRPC
jgi:uncharacterized protein YkwD